jgi:ATP-dependent DNA helicase RecG
MASLSDPVRFLKGVGPEMARRLARLEIHTIRDLLFHVPTAYRDRRAAVPISRLTPGAEASIVATLADCRVRAIRGRRDLTGTLRDETGFVRVVWFNQAYLASSLRVGDRYFLSGKVKAFRGLELCNPEFEPLDSDDPRLHVGLLAPRYSLTEGVAERWLRARVRGALDDLPRVPDVVPEEWRSRCGVPPLSQALEEVHFPPRPEAAEPARRRLALEELLTLQVALQFARRKHRGQSRAPSLERGAAASSRFVGGLPFPLTRAQERALGAVGADLDLRTPMRRLLLGDVGSGKTVVALAAAVRAVGAGHQAAILAPTALLAEQHAATAARFLAGSGVSFGLRTAATPAPERRRLEAGFRSGEIPLAIGTHALLERDVSFRSLALVVVDEQHRFGVRQRITLAQRGDPETSAHLLVLTATPIPRSLALTLYGDLDLSLLDEKPPGRAPVETKAIDGGRPGALIELLEREAAAGGSAFVVYPVVEESEALDLKAATAMAAKLSSTAALAEAGVALVHGRLKAEERRRALARFRSGEARILVATTVVEVGLDIPEATLVAIEHPERFGLAQLHQLRGRVGRADRPGRCVLVLDRGIGVAARKRLQIFQTVSDGFRLAEEDLKLRGPGEILGTAQHGFPAFHAADPARDTDLVQMSREWGRLLLDRGQAEGGGEPKLRAWIEAHFAGADRYLGSG